MHFRKRGAKWYFIVTVPDEFGNKVKVSRVGGDTRADAAKAAHKFLFENVDPYGYYEQPETMPYSQFLGLWVREYVDIMLRPATARAYNSAINNHIVPALGEVPLVRLTPRALQNFVSSQRQLAGSTLAIIRNVLRRSLAYAHETCRFLQRNPAAQLRLPPARVAQRETHVFTPEQLEVIWQKFPRGHKFHMPIMLAYYTGMRLGECLALALSDVDMEAGMVSIHATMYDDGGAGELQPMPKTRSSIRAIPFSSQLAAELKAQQHWQKEQRLAYGKYWHAGGLVCTNDNGAQMTASRLRYFGEFCRQEFGAGSFHSLRHTHATMLLEAGVDLELVSKRLGHSSIVITSRVYSHITENRNSVMREALERAL